MEPDAGECLADLAERTAGWLDRSLIKRDGYEPTIAQLADSLRRGAVGYRAALAASPSEESLKAVVLAVEAAKVVREPRHRVSMLVNDWAAIETALAALRTTKEGEG